MTPQGRDLAYAPFTAEVLVVGSAPEVYRVSLEEGRFMTPLSSKSSGINACGEDDGSSRSGHARHVSRALQLINALHQPGGS
jgi:hypothetical protein